MATEGRVLTLNAGSSSLKAALFDGADRRVFSAQVSRVGLPDGDAILSADGAKRALDAPDHLRALEAVVEAAGERLGHLAAVGHRVVYGGPRFDGPRLVTGDVLAELDRLAPLDPDHMPAEIDLVRAALARFPGVPNVACFDTAFHRTMRREARIVPIPRAYEAMGVQRYGFHGLSYAYLMHALAKDAGEAAARGRVILLHLGSGASLAAVENGQCVDTTMGFTPTSGIPMSTRSGDLDPGVVLYLMRQHRLDADALDELLNRRSGLLGISETTPDMRDLLAREDEDPRAADAVRVFVYAARKAVGALAATLGGVDTIVFSGGIGENSAPIRARIARGLAHLGARLDEARNQAGAPVISEDRSPTTLRVIPTDEESTIARETLRVVETDRGAHP